MAAEGSTTFHGKLNLMEFPDLHSVARVMAGSNKEMVGMHCVGMVECGKSGRLGSVAKDLRRAQVRLPVALSSHVQTLPSQRNHPLLHTPSFVPSPGRNGQHETHHEVPQSCLPIRKTPCREIRQLYVERH